MGFFSSMSPKHHLYDLSQNYPFMTCVVRVDTQSRWTRWERTVARVLNKCHGVHSFRMDYNGMVEISGRVDPSVVLRMLGRAGRSAVLCWSSFGECSSNLFMPTNTTGGGSAYSYDDGGYLHAPSAPPMPQNYVYEHDKMCYEKYGYEHVHGYQHRRRQQGYQYQCGYGIRGDEDIGCCILM